MRVDVRADYGTRVDQALSDTDLRTALERATASLTRRRAQAMDAVDAAYLRDAGRAAREHAIRNLPRLLVQLEERLLANGCQVHWAKDAADATRTVLNIASRHGARRIVKSKSMVTEEIGLNRALEAAGISVRETDLGEYIVQLAGEPPSHITAPVIHRRVEDIGELFHRELGVPLTDDPARLCAVARAQLRDEFLHADLGISGCNFAIADTGTICIITNEGNGRMVTSLPPVYIAVAGIEKVVATLDDAVTLWQAASRSATGQDASVYFSMSSGPRGTGHADGPEEMHVILLDNGRARILQRGYGEALLCIRCGACLNVCPVYREIGGHSYGPTPYSGPIGAVVTPLLADDPGDWKDLPFASSLCGACRDACPVKIDLPRLLLDLRHLVVQGSTSSYFERMGTRLYAWVMSSPRRYRLISKLVPWLEGAARRLPPLSTWLRTRDLPSFAPRTFQRLWGGRSSGDHNPLSDRKGGHRE